MHDTCYLFKASATRKHTDMNCKLSSMCLFVGSGLLSQKPQDSVTIVGKSAYFNCSTSEPSKLIVWYHYAINEVHREAIYQYANFTEYWYPCYRKGRYVVERNPETGAFNLVIPMVILSDAGRYLCEVDGDEGMASLTVQVQGWRLILIYVARRTYIDLLLVTNS